MMARGIFCVKQICLCGKNAMSVVQSNLMCIEEICYITPNSRNTVDPTKTSVNALSKASATQESLKGASSSTPCDSIVAEVTTSNVSKDTFKAAAQGTAITCIA